jgi:hypothetical protein
MTPKFIIDMKQPPRSMKHENRRTASPSHNHTSDRTRPRDDRADAGAYAFNVDPTALVASVDPGAIADHMRQMQMMIDEIFRAQFIKSFEPPPVPHAGIRVGEIIGYRLWWVDQSGLLRSVIADKVVWPVDRPVTGSIDHIVLFDYGLPCYGGVYCYKDFNQAHEQFIQGTKGMEIGYPWKPMGVIGLALGSVKLWGEVVEHEHGYRASFAKPASLDEIHYWAVPKQDPRELYFSPKPQIKEGTRNVTS